MTFKQTSPVELQCKLADAGIPICEIAGFMGIPITTSPVTASSAEVVKSLAAALPNTAQANSFAPNAVSKMLLWAKAIAVAQNFGPEFTQWVSNNVLQHSDTPDVVLAIIRDLTPWIAASIRATMPEYMREAATYEREWLEGNNDPIINHPFNSALSIETVIELSNAWHEARAKIMSAQENIYPTPWYNSCAWGDYTIQPILGRMNLYAEGVAVRSDIMPLLQGAYHGHSYYYSVRKLGKRMATVELDRKGSNAELGKIIGFIDDQTRTEIMKLLDHWLEVNKRNPLPRKHPDDEVPFC